MRTYLHTTHVPTGCPAILTWFYIIHVVLMPQNHKIMAGGQVICIPCPNLQQRRGQIYKCGIWRNLEIHVYYFYRLMVPFHVDSYIHVYMYMYTCTCINTCTYIHVHVYVSGWVTLSTLLMHVPRANLKPPHCKFNSHRLFH